MLLINKKKGNLPREILSRTSSKRSMFSISGRHMSRYAYCIGTGWALRSLYDNTKVSGEVKLNSKGIEGVEGSLTYKDSATISIDTTSEGVVVGSVKVEDVSKIMSESPSTDKVIFLSPTTEFLIQASLVVGLLIEVSIILVLILFFYKYGFQKGYLIMKKKFNDVKKPEFFSLQNLFIIMLFVWVCSIDILLNNLVELTFEHTEHLKKLYTR